MGPMPIISFAADANQKNEKEVSPINPNRPRKGESKILPYLNGIAKCL